VIADNLREKFLEFFKSKKHKVIDSDSLVPREDETVLFTPAGMNQFKKEFLGFNNGFKRAASSQRCLRTDDLDKVGKTAAHHTFFEMLGNFSFGDYFKKEAICWAWEFLTQELKISKERLWISVYKDDEEALRIWKDEVKVPVEKIVKLGDKDNFWPAEAKEKGPNGPCGPCSEIFFDRGKEFGCGRHACSPSCECGRFVEVWNLVFTQFNRKEGGKLEPLPNKNIDTGMGLERLTAVMEDKESNFETCLFSPLVEQVISEIKVDLPENRPAIYAISDHLRAIVFAIYDGVLPSNETRGYVVRKIIRKASLHLTTLGVRRPFLYRMVHTLSEIMKVPYPQLASRRENIAQIILAEEENFREILVSSENIFAERFSVLVHKPDPEKAGKIAFELYDTKGIPFELTKEWLDKHTIAASEKVFHSCLEEAKTRSKKHSNMKGEVFSGQDAYLSLKDTVFTGYKQLSQKAKILRVIKGNAPAKKISEGDEAVVVLDKTCFYAESGGQVGDDGRIIKGKNIFEVSDTKKVGRVFIHLGRVKQGSFRPLDEVQTQVDSEKRIAVARNHTATHLLQAALRKVLGEHVRQQGSLVSDEKLRFDFTHFKDITDDQLRRIEEVVNGCILDNCKLSAKEMPLAKARKSGALAFFGEKYQGRVRVVVIGGFSSELCGGTHLEATGQIGVFRITQEGSIASGVRRIEAVTGYQAYKRTETEELFIKEVSQELGVPPESALSELKKRLARIKELEKQLIQQKSNIAKNSVDSIISRAESLNQVKFISDVLEGADMDFLRKTADLIKQQAASAVIALGATAQEKAMLVVAVTSDLIEKGFDASKLIAKPARILGGSGGGRKDFSQAGGRNPQMMQEAFKEIRDSLKG